MTAIDKDRQPFKAHRVPSLLGAVIGSHQCCFGSAARFQKQEQIDAALRYAWWIGAGRDESYERDVRIAARRILNGDTR